MDDDGPYRGGLQVATCPRCKNTCESDGVMGRLACAQGCGEWYPRAELESVIAWSQVTSSLRMPPSEAWPWGPAPCPVCDTAMLTSYRDELRFDRCDAHGVWLDAGECDRFIEMFRTRAR
jgi:Zn-finger nucleic acid-binding protein